MKKHNVLLFVRTESQLMLAANAAGEITISATVARPGHFNDKTTVEIGHAEAARIYLWLGELVGKAEEVQL